MPTLTSQFCIASATNSGPLSERMYSGVLWRRSSGLEFFENIFGAHSGANCDGQCLPGELVQNSQHLVASPVAELVEYEVAGPDVVWMRRPEANDRTVFVIEPSALLVALQKLQPFLTPKPLNLLVIDLPALDAQEFCYLAIAVAPILFSQPYQGQPQRIVVSSIGLALQGAPRQSDNTTCPPLRRRKLLACMKDGLTKLLCGQALGFRNATLSLRISLSNSSSATIFLRRTFSFSRLRISDNCDRPIQPNRFRQLKYSHR
jgi:hypothetical protein